MLGPSAVWTVFVDAYAPVGVYLSNEALQRNLRQYMAAPWPPSAHLALAARSTDEALRGFFGHYRNRTICEIRR